MKAVQFLVIVMMAMFASVTPYVHAQQGGMSPDLKTKYHEFDFWLGKWDVSRFGTTQVVGKSHIQSINDSTAILENYETTVSPYKGKSLNTYNRKTGLWEQYWTDNGGLILKLEGGLVDGKMVLQSKEDSIFNKITWESLEDGSVRQSWEVSNDSGTSWKTVFDGIYRKQ